MVSHPVPAAYLAVFVIPIPRSGRGICCCFSNYPITRFLNYPISEFLMVNHSVDATGTGGIATGGVRWYQIQDPNGASGGPTVAQQSTFAPTDASFRWMGSIASDSADDIGLGFSESSSIMFPGIGLTARTPSDPLNTLENEALVFEGNGS